MDTLELNKIYYWGGGCGFMIIKKTARFITIRDYYIQIPNINNDKFICKDEDIQRRCKLFIEDDEIYFKVSEFSKRYFKSNNKSCYEILEHEHEFI
jgi:hypothetical protein